MLRPATPLAVLLLAAFAMLLLATLSTPIIKAIPLGTYKDVNFGVFGNCNPSRCTSIEIGYDTSNLFTNPTDSNTFDLPSGTRTTLSAILIVHPVAALLTLIMLILAIAAHFHSPSHSSRYLLLVFIFGIITFLVCLLAFLIDVLLFVPHMAWGSYIVLAATILVFLSFIVSCAMRRTLVSRKARKRRIAENAEMSGENYYNRQAPQEPETTTTFQQPTVPVVSGANGPADKAPAFASYEKRDDRSSEERIPLTARSPSERSPNNVQSDVNMSGTTFNGPQRGGSNTSIPRDQYGNPMDQPPDNYKMRRDPSFERMNVRGRGGPPVGYRGRGGYGRGGYVGPAGPAVPYGPPGGRGGYGPPNGRGGYGAGRGGYGPPPNGRAGYGPRGGYGPGPMRGGRTPPPTYPGVGAYDRRPSPANAYGEYNSGREASPAPPGSYGMEPPVPSIPASAAEGGSFQAYRPDRVSELPRAESPPPMPGVDDAHERPVGQAVEMDASTGSPAHAPQGFGQFNNQLRDSDADVAGMLALQQARTSSPKRHDTYMSEGSRYSQDDRYVPPRQAWNSSPMRPSRIPSPLQIPSRPQELGNGTPPPPLPQQPPAVADNYYEDVDPRFTEPAPRPQQAPQHEPVNYDDLPPQPRSPAMSEQSSFTSISQRGINPRWNPPPNQGYGQQMPPRKPVGRNEVNVLNSNPDFQLLSSRGGPGGPRGGMIPGSAYPGI
ncbi:hypothetical protein M426DRAFT_73283 [Hypoxylon sp. CI-4A]|nr:hypothetical protein M426DRAFT_73283 [Hypoxylon sp. CI-4A]